MSTADDSTEGALQSQPVSVLREAIESGRLAHGILLYGDSLPALNAVLQDAAGRLLKTDKPLTHPDFFALRPKGKSRQITIGTQSERAGGQWPPNSMRRLIHDLQHSAGAGGNKVAVIYEADRMNKATQNAFLKTLEEPPRETTLFLLTTRPHALLATIRSRVFNFRIPAESAPVTSPMFQEWIAAYSRLIQGLCTHPPRGKGEAADVVMAAYGLTARFEKILQEQVDEAWAEEKTDLPENLEDDQKIALQTTIAKSIREQLFARIEVETRNAALIGEADAAQFAQRVRQLHRCVAELERLHTYVDVFNLKESAALELFLLRSLRIWAAG